MSPARIAIFLLIVTSIVGGIHYYLWARLVRDVALPAPWGDVATWTVRGLCALIFVGLLLRRAPRPVAEPIMWVVYSWLGVMFFLFVLLVATDAGRALVGLGAKLAALPAPDLERRMFLTRALSAAVAFAGVGLGGVGLSNVLRGVGVKRVQIPLAKLPKEASGTRIALISDLHVGPTIGKEYVEDVVARVNALGADLVAITGDLVDGSVEDLGPLVAPLKELRARHGVFFVTGNHEYYSGVEDWLAFLPTLGIKVLHNERVPIGGDAGFDLAGITDLQARSYPGHEPDLHRALGDRDTSRAVVLLAHQPKAILEAEKHGVDLQLSGHTHGGQLFPWQYAVALDQPYVRGLHEHGSSKLYVSCGTGYWGPPMRVGAPAEITDIELVAQRG